MVRLQECRNDLRKVLGKTRGRYVVLDTFDLWAEVLYDGNDLREAKRARAERYEDTDGEANVVILVRDTGEPM